MGYFTKPPCYAENGDCPDRDTGCHTVCERYKEWQIVHNAEKEKRYAIYRKDHDIDVFECQQGSRISKLNRVRKIQEKARRR